MKKHNLSIFKAPITANVPGTTHPANYEKMKSKNTFWIIIAILIFLTIVIYVISLGQVNIISDAEHVEAEKRRQAEARYKELEAEMSTDLPLKRRLDSYVFWGFIVFKILSFAALIGVLVMLKTIFHLATWLEVFEMGVKVWGCFAFVVLFFLGLEIKFVRYYKYMKNLIKTWVYRKYGNLEAKIVQNQQEMDQIKNYLDKKVN